MVFYRPGEGNRSQDLKAGWVSEFKHVAAKNLWSGFLSLKQCFEGIGWEKGMHSVLCAPVFFCTVRPTLQLHVLSLCPSEGRQEGSAGGEWSKGRQRSGLWLLKPGKKKAHRYAKVCGQRQLEWQDEPENREMLMEVEEGGRRARTGKKRRNSVGQEVRASVLILCGCMLSNIQNQGSCHFCPGFYKMETKPRKSRLF